MRLSVNAHVQLQASTLSLRYRPIGLALHHLHIATSGEEVQEGSPDLASAGPGIAENQLVHLIVDSDVRVAPRRPKIAHEVEGESTTTVMCTHDQAALNAARSSSVDHHPERAHAAPAYRHWRGENHAIGRAHAVRTVGIARSKVKTLHS